MSYWQHLRANWWVGAKCVLMAAFHIVHGIVPIEWTSHEWWGLGWPKRE